MIVICVALIVLLGVAVSAASYFIATTQTLGKIVRDQKRQGRRELRRSEALLDRLVMRHGFTPLTEAAKTADSGAVISMPVSDPFEAAEEEWEREDLERYRAMTALDDDERKEIVEAARARNVH